MNNFDAIKKDLNNIHALLASINEDYWSDIIHDYLFRLGDVKNSEELKSVARELLKFYGGMGSLNDLVLFQNGKMLSEENVRLDKLRHKMFQDLRKIVTRN